MKYLSKIKMLSLLFISGLIFFSCKIGYSFTRSSINYEKVSSISIKDFPNVAPNVYAPLAQQLTEAIKDKYTRQTKLKVLREGGDYDLEGEITGYNYISMAVTDGAYASQTRLTVIVRVRFTNNTDPEKDFEKNYSAYQDFSNDKTITQVQDELCKLIVEEIVDLIFNETVADW